MNFFEKQRAREPISVRELREAGRQIDQTYPLGMKGGNRGIRQIFGGTQVGDMTDDEEHLGIINAKIVGSLGDPIKYGITERWIISSSGALEDVPQPIKFDGTKNFALAVGGVEYFVNDIVAFARSKRDPDVYEIKKYGVNIVPNCSSINIIVYRYACTSGALVETPTSYNIKTCIDRFGNLTMTIA